MPFVQQDRYITGTRFDPHEIEDALDIACAERQELREQTGRAVKVPVTSNTKPEDYMAAFWKAVADILKSVGIVADAEDYIKRYVSGIPIIKKSLAEVESGADGYYWVTGFGDAGKPGHDISGRLVTADGSTESRTLGERFADIVNVKDFGAKGDGVTDDTEAIMRAAEVAAARPASLYMPGSYLVHGLILPENTHVLGRPLFVDDGSGEESSYLVVFGRNSSIDDISLKMVENGHYRYGVRFNEGCSAGTVYVYAKEPGSTARPHISWATGYPSVFSIPRSSIEAGLSERIPISTEAPERRLQACSIIRTYGLADTISTAACRACVWDVLLFRKSDPARRSAFPTMWRERLLPATTGCTSAVAMT